MVLRINEAAILLRMFLISLTLFLSEAKNSNAGRTLHSRAATSAARTLITLLFFAAVALLATSSAVQAPIPNVGKVDVGDACFYEVTGIAHVNQSPCTSYPHKPFYSNLSNNFVVQAKMSISYQTDQVVLEGFDQLKNITRLISNITEVNITEITHGNGTLQNLSNFTNNPFLKNFTEWVPLPRLNFTYDGRSWEGVTITLPSKATAQYRVTLSPKQYGGVIEYSILVNASGLFAELEPPLNATAFNTTGNADLNLSDSSKCQPNCARYIDGKLIGAAGNRSNITSWMTFPTTTWQANPTLTAYNSTNTQLGITSINVGSRDGWLNLSVDDAGGNAAIATVARSGNISIPETNGVVVHGYMHVSHPDGGNNFRGALCFMTGWDNLANSTSVQVLCEASFSGKNTGLALGIDVASNFGSKSYFYSTGTGTATQIATTTTNTPVEFNWWFNWTHMNMSIDGKGSGLVSTGLTNLSSGVAATYYATTSGSAEARSIRFANVTIANVTDSGLSQPYNLTPAVLDTNVLNSTISVTSVKVSNISYQYANGNANFSVFDANHANLQYITEGSFNTLSSITGYGINATLIPPTAYIASEFTSFLTETNVGNTAPTITSNITNNTSPRFDAVVSVNANFSDDIGLSFGFVESNITGSVTNVTVPLSGTTSNATFNFTNALRYSVGNVNTTYFRIYVNDSSNTITTSNAQTFTVANTPPTIPAHFSPATNSFHNTTTVTFNLTNGSDADRSNLTIYSYTDLLFNNTYLANFTLAGLNEGNHSFIAAFYDGTSYGTNSTGINFTADTIFPTVTFSATQTDAANTFLPVPRIRINITSTELNPSTINATIYNGTGQSQTSQNYSLNTSNTLYNIFNFTALPDGPHNISIKVSDKAGNLNTSTNRTITIDTTQPRIDNGTGIITAFIRATSYIANYTWTETNNDTFYIRNGTISATPTNTSPSANTSYFWLNFTGLLEASATSGNYTFTGWINDSAGNANTTTNVTIVPDLTLPIVENGTISTTAATVGNPFTIRADYFDLWLGGVNATIAGINHTMTCDADSCEFTYTNTSVVGNYITDRLYAQDRAGNIQMNVTNLIFTANPAAGATSGGGGGGGGGGLLVIEKEGVQLTINGTLTATPNAINAYANYFTTANKPKTWSKTVTANSLISKCLITGPFTCSINNQDPTQTLISKTYTQTGFAQTFKGSVTLANTANNAITIPVTVTSFNTGASLPFTFTIPEGISFLTPSLFFNHLPNNKAQLRWTALAILLFIPTFAPAVKGLSRAARFKGNGRTKSAA